MNELLALATYKIIQRLQKTKDNGEAPLYLRITHNRKTTYKSTGIYVLPKYWDSEKCIVSSKTQNSNRINYKLANDVSKAQKAALDLEINDSSITSKAVKKKLGSGGSFLKYFEAYVDELSKTSRIGSYKKANTVLAKVKEHIGETDIQFEEINVTWLKDFESFLREGKGNGVNTIHSNLKIIRRLINEAVKEDLIPINKNPFYKYKLKWENAKKEYLTEKELKSIEDLNINKKTIQYHHRNIYVFACYAGGIRISDVLQLKWKNFNGTNIIFSMQKTTEPVSVKLPNKALDIINSYKGKSKQDDLVFPLLKKSDLINPHSLFDAISRATAHANKNLKEIFKTAKIHKNLSFHSSRHTWATRALRKGMRIEYVSKLMGHQSIKVTQVYAKIVNEELDNAMDIFN